MVLTFGDVALRDIRVSDVEDCIRWETIETEWQLWDAPWEYEGRSAEQCAAELDAYVALLRSRIKAAREMQDRTIRERFEIDYRGQHVGSCASYPIDSDCNVIPRNSGTPSIGRAVGVCVNEPDARRHHVATRALTLFIDYLRDSGTDWRIFTQTWSGNKRMIGLAHKLGFEEYRRKPHQRTVRGEKYDGLTFELGEPAWK